MRLGTAALRERFDEIDALAARWSPYQVVTAVHPKTEHCAASGRVLRTAAGFVGRKMRSQCGGCRIRLEWED